MTITINPDYLRALYAFGLMDQSGRILPQAMEWRWATINDANHDWDRIAHGLQPERTVPPVTCTPAPPDSSPPSSSSPSSPGSFSAS